MLNSWISFWMTYYIIGGLLYDDTYTKIINTINTKELLYNLSLNALITLIFVPVANNIPTLIYVPDTIYGYILRILLALIIGDLCFYSMHRLFHHPFLYKYHKMHHNYIKPHSFAGLYSHPIEMLLSNHLSMVLALKLITSHSNIMLMIESASVALSILINHSGKNNIITGSVSHNMHHKNLKCNYGFLYLSDYIFGTLQYA